MRIIMLLFILFYSKGLYIPVLAQTTTNWNGSTWDNGEPNANNHVVIGSGTFTTSTNSNFHCKNLTIESGATLVIVAGDTFSVSGVLTNNGTITNNGHMLLRSCGTYSVQDIDGNRYTTVQIGNQCWMQSNLKVTKYRNGDNITHLTDSAQWVNTISAAYCTYNNNILNDSLFGKLYNWYAVNDPRGICPTGWHAPSANEWSTLIDFLGGEAVAGGKMKTGSGWDSPNPGSTNSSGFTARPAGVRSVNGRFLNMGNTTGYWSSSVYSTSYANLYYLGHMNAYIFTNGFGWSHGYSVRCIRDLASSTLPSVTTTSASSVTSTGASTGGQVTATGGGSITARGVVYGTSSSPTLSGSFTYNGNESGSFTSTLSGLNPSTTYYVRAYATNTIGTAYGPQVNFTTAASYVAGSVHCSGSGAAIVEVTNPTTGKIWMDRNLGAAQLATSSTDAQAYGDLYQWGRGADGHQCRNSATTSSLSVSDQPASSSFITNGSAPFDWRSPQNNNLWQGLNGTNNPCPTGFRLPTQAELDAERQSWSSNNASGAFSSPLKWTQAGLRSFSNAGIGFLNSFGCYWSSTTSGSDPRRLHFLRIESGASAMGDDWRANGFSVRCIKN